MFNIIKLNEKDNIGIAPMEIPENTKINFDSKSAIIYDGTTEQALKSEFII